VATAEATCQNPTNRSRLRQDSALGHRCRQSPASCPDRFYSLESIPLRLVFGYNWFFAISCSEVLSMKSIGRRSFFRNLLTSGVLAGAGAAQTVQPAPQNAGNSPFSSRRMDEMTSREIEFYLKSGGDLALIPFGPISGHGALIPVGMHAHWAHALSLLIADKANGLVFPLTHCCFAGATRTFRGTVSFTHEEQVMVLKRIASTLNKQGFRRTVLVGGTNPEDTAGTIAARELFDETEKPSFFISARRAFDLPEVKGVVAWLPRQFQRAADRTGKLEDPGPRAADSVGKLVQGNQNRQGHRSARRDHPGYRRHAKVGSRRIPLVRRDEPRQRG